MLQFWKVSAKEESFDKWQWMKKTFSRKAVKSSRISKVHRANGSKAMNPCIKLLNTKVCEETTPKIKELQEFELYSKFSNDYKGHDSAYDNCPSLVEGYNRFGYGSGLGYTHDSYFNGKHYETGLGLGYGTGMRYGDCGMIFEMELD